MRAVVQRVRRASVTVDGEEIAAVGRGFLVLLGVGEGDSERDADYLAAKIAGLRVFEDNEGRMNRSLVDVAGAALVVSQFTLFGDCRKGRRPSFVGAAAPQEAERLYEYYVAQLRRMSVETSAGVFGAMMDVELVNDGPVTLLLDSSKLI